MIQMLRLVLAGCVVSLVLSPDTAWCQFRFPCGDKQQCYDDDWTEHRSGQYWYVRYYFKADPKADAFGYHYVIFFPNRENLYYYNPQKKTYWCRALINQPRGVDGRPRKNKIWNVLPAQGNVRKQRLEDIPESEWEKNQSVPNIPGTGKDGPLMEFPPQPPNVS